MAYCVVADVRAIVDTDITDAEISDLIDRTDARIDFTLNSGALPALILEDISSLWTAYRCMLKDPNARSMGAHSERRDVTLQKIKDEIAGLISLSGGGIAFTAAVETL